MTVENRLKTEAESLAQQARDLLHGMNQIDGLLLNSPHQNNVTISKGLVLYTINVLDHLANHSETALVFNPYPPRKRQIHNARYGSWGSGEGLALPLSIKVAGGGSEPVFITLDQSMYTNLDTEEEDDAE